jgi:hypothetical protein
VKVPGERTYDEFRKAVFKRNDRIDEGVAGWKAYRTRMADALGGLLGDAQALPPEGTFSTRAIQPAWADGLSVEEIWIPSEAGILIPAIAIAPPPGRKIRTVEIHLTQNGRASAAMLPAPYRDAAREGGLVVLPDIRFSGEYGARRLAGRLRPELLKFKMAYPLRLPGEADQASNIAGAWDRNGIIWGRAVPGMMAHDLRAVIDALAGRPESAGAPFRVIARDTAALACAALLEACRDSRVAFLDADFRGHRFEKTPLWRDDLAALPVISSVLVYGDIPQWAVLMADRHLILRGMPLSAAEADRLKDVFGRMGNGRTLSIMN